MMSQTCSVLKYYKSKKNYYDIFSKKTLVETTKQKL